MQDGSKKLKNGLYDEIKSCPPLETRAEIADFLRMLCGHEVRFLKKGRYGCVYSNRATGTIIKVGDADNNEGYLAYLRLARQNQDNPFFPQIHYAALFADGDGGERYFVVKMEKLIEGKNYLKRRLHMPGWWRVSQFIQKSAMKEGYELDNFLGQQTPTTLKDYMWILKQAFRGNSFKWDIHGDNMMMRENGQLVITDPWA